MRDRFCCNKSSHICFLFLSKLNTPYGLSWSRWTKNTYDLCFRCSFWTDDLEPFQIGSSFVVAWGWHCLNSHSRILQLFCFLFTSLANQKVHLHCTRKAWCLSEVRFLQLDHIKHQHIDPIQVIHQLPMSQLASFGLIYIIEILSISVMKNYVY
jgi:hypothetical protein